MSEYKVRWEPRGKERLDDTWEDASNLLACDWAIERYWAGFESAAEASKKANRAPAAGATEAQEGPTQQSIYDKYLAAGAAPSAALWDKALSECAVVSTSGTKRRRRTCNYTPSCSIILSLPPPPANSDSSVLQQRLLSGE